MNKAFTRESDGSNDDGDDELEPPSPLPAGSRNYITPAGYTRLKTELKHLLDRERPDVVKAVSWAASNGDRSENADYIYGKRRLREIDRRIRFLTRRLDAAVVVDPSRQEHREQVFFGAAIDDGERGPIADHFGVAIRQQVSSLDPAYIFRRPDRAMRVMAPQIRIHEVIGDEAGFRRQRPRGLENATHESAQRRVVNPAKVRAIAH